LSAPQLGEILLAGAPTQQIHNLALGNVQGKTDPKDNYGDTQKAWFDLIIIDEASQMDVASSSLVFTKAAPQGACILAGDHLQLPPIHAAQAPRGMEHLVGPVFSYFIEHHALPTLALDDNYRSNGSIVEFVRQAGYSSNLNAHFHDLELNLSTPVPTTRPCNWPSHLPFSPHYASILDPQKPLLCFVAQDDSSRQSNPFEAQTIAALSWLLWQQLAKPFSRTHHRTRASLPYPADVF